MGGGAGKGRHKYVIQISHAISQQQQDSQYWDKCKKRTNIIPVRVLTSIRFGTRSKQSMEMSHTLRCSITTVFSRTLQSHRLIVCISINTNIWYIICHITLWWWISFTHRCTRSQYSKWTHARTHTHIRTHTREWVIKNPSLQWLINWQTCSIYQSLAFVLLNILVHISAN